MRKNEWYQIQDKDLRAGGESWETWLLCAGAWDILLGGPWSPRAWPRVGETGHREGVNLGAVASSPTGVVPVSLCRTHCSLQPCFVPSQQPRRGSLPVLRAPQTSGPQSLPPPCPPWCWRLVTRPIVGQDRKLRNSPKYTRV